MKSAFSIINFCSKLNFGRKRPCRYFATANSALSSFNYADEDCFTSELPAATNSDVDSEEQNYFGNDVQVSKGLKADDDEMKLIKLILGNHGFNLGSHPKQLEIVRILDILFEESSDARLCLYYFKWSGCLSGSNRSLESICRMIHILVAGNMNHRAVDLMSHLVKNYGSKEGFSTILLKLFYETHHERKTLETTCSMLVDCYIKERMVTAALILMGQMKSFDIFPSIWVYKSVIQALLQTNQSESAWDLLEEMHRQGGYCKVGNINRAFSYLGKMLKSGIRPSVITYTLFIDYFCKRRDVEMAEVMLQKMIIEGLNPDVVTYNILMDGYGKKGYLHKAFELLDTMRSTNLTPDVVTYNTLINGLVTRGFLQEAKDMLDELNRRGFNIDVVTYTNIIHGYSKRGNFEEAFLVWFHMTDNCVKPDVVTCSALLSGYCRERRIDEANALFCKMLDIGLNPDLILYNTLIHGFCSVGNVDEGCNLVKKMIENSILPNNVTHRALVLGFQKRKVIDPIESATSKLQEILLAYDLQIDANGYI
ncbi:pentatricopeptide repeat-containing protein At2g19280 isoform X2 [Cucurbita moschata]|uniref:Pentatricopeptide repeat-containing protein At2g19280 isoform X2 n=1 Tax=Cucurbita moschata TaxID=3662 RepID=A0A6J1GZD1_CUCMO|nr:pentatricopeptide repeat-containing protein At2g19280 isoform X2 [Cucurbita moschata]